jgi:hypothetical protein
MPAILSVIIHVIDVDDVSAVEAEDDTPIAADVDRPGTFHPTFQRVQPKTRQVHVSGLDRCLEARKEKPESLGMLRADPP